MVTQVTTVPYNFIQSTNVEDICSNNFLLINTVNISNNFNDYFSYIGPTCILPNSLRLKGCNKCYLLTYLLIVIANASDRAIPNSWFCAIFNSNNLASEKSECLLAGDYNLDLFKYESNTETETFVNNLYCHSCLPLITKPTRFTEVSSTLIDNI